MNQLFFLTKFWLITSLLFLPELAIPTQAQNLDSLIQKYEQSDPSDSIAGVYLLQLIESAEKQKAYDQMAEYTMQFYHHYSPVAKSTAQKQELLRRAISYESKIEDSETRGSLHLKLAGAFYDLQQFDSAILEYSAAMERFEPKDSIFLADAYFFRGQANDYQGNLLNGMQDYQEAEKIYSALGDEEYANYVKGGMAILFSKFSIFNKAEKIRNELISYALANENLQEYAIQLYNKASDYQKQGRKQEHLEHLLKADSLAVFEPVDYYLAVMLKLNLSIYYGEQADLEKQSDYLAQAKTLLPKVPTISASNPTYLKAQGSLAYNQGKYDAAKKLAEQSLQNAKASENMDHIIHSYELLTDIHQKLNEPQKALETHQTLIHYKDSLFTANQASTFSYYQTLYETEKKELEILNKTQEIESINQKNSARLRWIFLIISLLIVGATVIFLWKNLQHEKRKKEMQSKFTQELLKNQEQERVRISKDLHDGIGQSLLLIKNKVALAKDTDTGELLDTAISELRAIARSLHPMQLEKLGFTKAAEHLLEQIDQETEIFVSYEIDNLESVLNKNIELQLYRILQESINNVLKHSDASALRVNFRKIEQAVELKIEDNGQGFDFSQKLNDFQSLGLKTLKERIASLSGTMKVNSEKGMGTSLSFIVYV
ncbi:sensor histidine kinase [Algoriphagus halophytocola]|uniref:tetratricopeptide repeat-containing sensor histidine kinase n=1 Tax=Algoriphagus halophytocola TaxID=2991499 RepID=UPI0022DE5EF4|nr:sensor histidine kinase [Algoriphagus sp. TR-M9]WBL43222.1 sensor histidine kinase [Algoriphagus sp. TR-M9]